MVPVFVFDRLNIDHYLTSNNSKDSKFHAIHRYVVEICKKSSVEPMLRFQ